MRLVLFTLVLATMAGCAGADEPAADAADNGPLYDGSDRQLDVPDDGGYDCSNVTLPERWYGHRGGEMWCVKDPGQAWASGSIVTPAGRMQSFFAAKNGSIGHEAGTPIEGHAFIMCDSGLCQADVTIEVNAGGQRVVTLQKVETIEGTLLTSGTWIDLEGTLDQPIPADTPIDIRLHVTGIGGLMSRGHAGDWAPWLSIGTASP